MSRSFAFSAVLSVVTAFAFAGSASAQYSPYRQIPRRPSFSPYLNLVRPGDPTLNYFGLVRPELEFRQSINGLQQQTSALNDTVSNPVTTQEGIRPTGNSASFMNLSHYYKSRGSAGSSAPIGGPGSFGVARPSGPGSFGTSRPTGPGSFQPGAASSRRN